MNKMQPGILVRFTRQFVRPVLHRQAVRGFTSASSGSKPVHSMDDINTLFAEARLSLQDAVESKGTVYFEDDFEDAKKVTKETLQAFDTLCASVSAVERQSLMEMNRPKMAQLKEEFKNLEDELIHDE